MKAKRGHAPDYFLMVLIVSLTVFGLVMLASASSDLGKIQFNDSYYYLKHQILFGITLGLAGFLSGYFIYYQRLKKAALPMLVVSVFFCALVFTKLGSVVNDTNRWLRFGAFSFQPAELMKFTYLTYLAAWLSNVKLKRESNFVQGFLPFLCVSGIIAGLLIFQPATSTVVILLSSGLVVYFMSGAPFKYILGTIAVAVLLIGAVIMVTPYRLARITGFLNQNKNTQSQNYQVNHGLIAIGSGGLAGVGYGQSVTKASYLPAPIDDSIFAVIAEELGFIGAGALIGLFGLFACRPFLACEKPEFFARLFLIGFATVVLFQAF